ncbi:hypothetical protein B0H14DRAFT_2572533 [Mycena olivaceomarginata]|nr:hypothetical protein B0H14DRAFT_2572533 [Mycena olivaceomarginata]
MAFKNLMAMGSPVQIVNQPLTPSHAFQNLMAIGSEIISSSLPQDYLFPNLRSIRLEPHDYAELSFIPLFAGPQLTDITLSVVMSASGILLLPTLDLRYQQLTTLCIETFPREPGVCASTSKIALNLDRVEILALDKPDLAALEYLGQLPSLS